MRGWETRDVGPQPSSAQQRRAVWGEGALETLSRHSSLALLFFFFHVSVFMLYISSRKHHTTKGHLSLKGNGQIRRIEGWMHFPLC